eukprot:gene33418-40426_t
MNPMSDEETARKRGLQQEDIDAAMSSKRAALGGMPGPYGDMGGGGMDPMGMGDHNLLFKILCPQTITGLIIGRGGSIINQLNATVGAKIRLSQNNEFFPGTTDRILVVNGPKDGIANAARELVTRIAEAPDRKPNSGGPPPVDMYGNPIPPANRGANGTFQIKVLIPRTASAAIIGKGGAVIKQMAEHSNCKFQLGDENDPFNTKERVVIINSTAVPNLVLGVQTIMAQLLDDPRIRVYSNTNTHYGPTGPGAGPGGMPMGAGPRPMMPGMPMGAGGYGMPMPPHHSPYMNPYGMMPPGPMGMPGMPPHHGHPAAAPNPAQPAYGMPPQGPPGGYMSPPPMRGGVPPPQQGGAYYGYPPTHPPQGAPPGAYHPQAYGAPPGAYGPPK